MRSKSVLLKICVITSFCAVTLYGVVDQASAYPAKEAPIQNGTLIPTGVRITPSAAPGSTFAPLNPGLVSDPSFTVGQAVTTATSPDGKTLLILTSGYNSQNFTSGPNLGNVNPAESNEYIFVFDLSGGKPLQTQVLQIPNAFDGLVWNPNGNEFYASGGPSDNIHIFTKSGAAWTETVAPIALGHGQALGLGSITPGAMGLAVTADGTRLLVANYENDSITLVDIAARTKITDLDLRPGNGTPGGEYPIWVAIKGNTTAYVSSARDREIDVVDISTNTPVVTSRIPLKGSPTRLALNKKQTLLYVTETSSDSVAVISTATRNVMAEVSTTAPQKIFANHGGFKGSSPNSLALSPDEESLYVTNGGANSVAVIRLTQDGIPEGGVSGLIPTGWYPNSVSVSADGSTLYVVNGKSNAGPNPQNCRDAASLQPGGTQAGCSAANQYVWQLTKAGFLTVPVPHGEDLEDVTAQVARNNRYDALPSEQDKDIMQFLHNRIKHVIYIVKENRTYDQILGDLPKGNGDPSIVVYPQPITPNQHALASKFTDVDNFYDSGEVSGDGWNWSTAARAADTIEKTEPINYAGRGLNYDYEGTNRNINVGYASVAERIAANPVSPSDPNLLPGTADVSAPDSPEGEAGTGYLWDAALRAGLTIRNYGFFIDLTRYSIPVNAGGIAATIRDPFASGTQVSFPTKVALQPVSDQFFRGYDNKFPDFYRVKEWEREFDQFEESGDLPNLELVRVMHDHTGNFGTAIDGVNTPEIQTADNDYAVGLIVEKVAKSKRYRDNTLVIVLEDDAQDGPDHVDAHRSIAFFAGPYVKQGAVVSNYYTTVNVIATIVDILGIEHLGTTDAVAQPMTDIFSKKTRSWDFQAIVPDILRTTQLPLPAQSAKRAKTPTDPLWALYARPRHDAHFWDTQTHDFNFNVEDKLDTGRYNLILWKGLIGDGVPYPTVRTARDLRRNREALLKQWRSERILQLSTSVVQNAQVAAN
jgi:YVTN family beta-propeller protein